MKRYLQFLGLGFLVWLIPFIVSFFVFPTKAFFAPLFETLMAITVAATGVVFTGIGFRGVQSGFIKEGVVLGAIFFAVSVLIDLPLFSYGPMAASFASYMLDVGLTYLIYPVIAIGMGYILETKNESQKVAH